MEIAIHLPHTPLTLPMDAACSIKQPLNMDDQSSPSNPKPPTQTTTANRETVRAEEQHHSRGGEYTKVLQQQSTVCFVSYLSAGGTLAQSVAG